MRGKRTKKNKSSTKKLIIALIIFIIAAGGVLAYNIIKDKENQETAVPEEMTNDVITAPIEEKTVQTFKGNDRPIAVMIDNHKDAWPQARITTSLYGL